MYYTNARLLWPNSVLNAEFRLPEAAQLQGLTYDFTDHSLVTYDAAENKIMWISRDDAAVRASAEVATDVHEVMGMCQFDGRLYMLSYEGDGHAAVYNGSLTEARENYVLNLTRHALPYNVYIPTGVSLWDRTHAATIKYMRYHPDFCSIFNVGPSIYLILGLANNVSKDVTPPELGQYFVEYELNGTMRYHTRLDYTVQNRRWDGMPNTLNGTAVAAVYHDGCVDLLCRDKSNSANDSNIIHTVKHDTRNLAGPLTFESAWFLSGHAGYNTDMTHAGRQVYLLIDNRIYRSDIVMLKAELDGGWPNTQTIDLGNMCPNQLAYRSVTIKNVSMVTTYYDIVISSDDPLLTISLENSLADKDYAPTVKLLQAVAPGDTFTMYVRLASPNIVEGARTPYQYLSKISFRPDRKVEYA